MGRELAMEKKERPWNGEGGRTFKVKKGRTLWWRRKEDPVMAKEEGLCNKGGGRSFL